MEFEVHNEVRDEVRIVSIRGELDLAVADRFTAVLSAAASDVARALVIDLVGCAFIDSTGLATIIGETRPLRSGCSAVAIASPSGSDVHRVLELMGVSQAMPTFDTVDEAIAATARPA